MKINNTHSSTPTFGAGNDVVLTPAEKKRAQDIAATMHGLSRDVLQTLRQALGTEVLRLQDAREWTGDSTEPDRRELHEAALLMYHAVDRAWWRATDDGIRAIMLPSQGSV